MEQQCQRFAAVHFPIGHVYIPIGEFSAGAYTLQVDRTYMSDHGVILTETLPTLPFVVAGTNEASPLPSLGAFELSLLAFALAAIAIRALRTNVSGLMLVIGAATLSSRGWIRCFLRRRSSSSC